MAVNQSEFNWIAIEGAGEGERGPRRFAVLVWIARTGRRTRARARPSVISPADLPSPLGDLVPPWLPILSPFTLEADDRPLFMAVLYDLDRPDRRPYAVEIAIEHEDFDAATFSATTAGGDLQIHQLEIGEPASFAIAIKARSADFDVELYLAADKGVLAFGNRGAPRLRQGPIETAYVQRPRLAVRGRIALTAGERRETIARFTGDACQDRQWLTVTATQVKWIWAQLRLDDGREILGYVMRDSGSGRWASPNDGRLLGSGGWLVERDGGLRPLPRFDVCSVEEHETRTDRGTCPTRFAVRVPELDLHVTLEHTIAAPFVRMKAFGPMLDAGIWEGPAHVVDASQPLAGHCWVEVMNAATAQLAAP